ncbi:hypothetical protein [Gulosibacter sediminis]|uniref:hypothetical protein n=1 Tax=Gulosibacter sediminis TaxID=1729695 RepID=UPI0024ACBBAD|nr:hypothetical protein [Gulosibacter sediminis]
MPTRLVLGSRAEYEARVERTGSWISVGYFLIDAAAGMIATPVTLGTDAGIDLADDGMV